MPQDHGLPTWIAADPVVKTGAGHGDRFAAQSRQLRAGGHALAHLTGSIGETGVIAWTRKWGVGIVLFFRPWENGPLRGECRVVRVALRTFAVEKGRIGCV